MKRSKQVVFASMRKCWRPAAMTPITVAVATVAITGCSDNDRKATIYQTLTDCIDDNPGMSQECTTAYKKALTEAARTAPKYDSRYACETEFGNNACIQQEGKSWFMPAMAGFMFYHMYDKHTGGYGYRSQPMFTSYQRGSVFYNDWTSADGYNYGNTYKKTTVTISDDHMKPKATVNKTISRGGFGSTVSAKSSWSRSSSSSKSSSWGWGG